MKKLRKIIKINKKIGINRIRGQVKKCRRKNKGTSSK
jgi:hypothetical protein